MLIVSMNQRWNWKAWTLQTSWHLSLDSLEVAPPPPPAWAPYHQIRHQFCPFRLRWQTSIQPQSQWIPAARSWISWQSLKFLVSCRVSFNIYIHELKKQIKNFFYQTTNYKLVTYFYCQTVSVLQQLTTIGEFLCVLTEILLGQLSIWPELVQLARDFECAPWPHWSS